MNMNLSAMRAFILLLGCSLSSAPAWAAETATKEEAGRKVDEPLPETYEPLMGSPRNEDFSQELKDLRRLKEEQKKQEQVQEEAVPAAGKQPATKTYPIQEPQPEAPAQGSASTPPVEEQGDQLRIRDR